MSRPATAFITSPQHHELSGPDFLRAVADKERSLGNDINAAEFERRADQWQRDVSALTTVPAIDQAAANGEDWPSPSRSRRSTALPTHHITPSDHR